MAGPLSITDLLEKQRKEKEEASKARPPRARAQPPQPHLHPPARPLSPPLTIVGCPCSPSQPKFLTKAERAALAVEKRQKEIEEQRAQGDRAKREREELDRKADEERRAAYNSRAQAPYGGQPPQAGGYSQPGGPNVRGGYGRGGFGGGRGGRGGYNDGPSLLASPSLAGHHARADPHRPSLLVLDSLPAARRSVLPERTSERSVRPRTAAGRAARLRSTRCARVDGPSVGPWRRPAPASQRPSRRLVLVPSSPIRSSFRRSSSADVAGRRRRRARVRH